MQKNIISPLVMSVLLSITFAISLFYPDKFIYFEESLSSYVKNGGIAVIILLSTIENFVLINALIPGAIVILTAMSLSGGNPTQALGIYLSIVVGAYIGQIASFVVGKKTGIHGDFPGLASFASTLWHPQLGSMTSFRAGQSNASFGSYIFRLTITAIPWSILWGLTLYLSGKQLSFSDQLLPLALIYCLVWLVIEFRK